MECDGPKILKYKDRYSSKVFRQYSEHRGKVV